MSYIIFDEYVQPIRIVGRREKAKSMCALRSGWVFKYIKAKKAEDYKFEPAPF